jgi:formylglycine-generating enzyme required for sulfatase activity
MDGAYAWYSGNSSSKTHIVGTRTPNGWGLYDMSGNVWEVCLDWFGNLSSAEDPKGSSSGLSRVIRGEHFSSSATDCNSLIRDDFSPTDVSLALGFRLTLHLGE